MSLDLGSPAIEIAIALSFVFFLLSIVVTTLTEAVAWLTKLRAKTLERGVKGLLGDEGLADELLAHPLVQTDLTTPAKKKKPSYLSARNFSLALVDVLANKGKADSGDALAEVESGVEAVGDDAPGLSVQLESLIGRGGAKDIDQFRQSAERWFDDAMDRVSGWYKRRAQAITCVLALVVAFGLKADAVRIAEHLQNEPGVRAAVVARAEAATAEPEAAGQSVTDATKSLESLKIPILWNKGNDDVDPSVIAGILLTAIAISLGAPFWFDTLGKLARLRTAGKKPEPATGD